MPENGLRFLCDIFQFAYLNNIFAINDFVQQAQRKNHLVFFRELAYFLELSQYKRIHQQIDILFILYKQQSAWISEQEIMTDNLYDQLLNPLNLSDPLKDPKQKNKLIRSLFGLQGFAKQHIDSFNQFVEFRANEIVTSKLNRRLTVESDDKFWMEYVRVKIQKPTHTRVYENTLDKNLYPQEARIMNLSYSGNICVDIRFSFGGAVEERKNVRIGRIPIMLGSARCHLNGLSEQQLCKLKQCPYDPKGYFIVNGTEKVIMIQQQMIENRILVQKNQKMDTVVAGVISYTIDTKTMLQILFKNGKIYVKLGSFTELIPVFVFFKAFGMQSDQEVFQSVECTPEMEQFLVLSLQDCYKRNIFTSQQAIQFLATKLWTKKFQSRKQRNLKQEVREKLCNIILAHIKVTPDNMLPKAHYLALMMKKLIDGINDPSKLDNRDYYGNKRMKSSGTLIELLFEDLFKSYNSQLQTFLNNELYKKKNMNLDITHYMTGKNTDFITFGFQKAIVSGNWSIKRFHIDRKGVSQLLSRISYISAIGMIGRLSSQFAKTRKIAGPRALLGSHWGLICPCDTPDGQGCGLDKNLALTTCVTTSSRRFKYTNLGIIEGNILQGKGYKVTVDGSLVGYTIDTSLVKRIRMMRRKGLFEKFVNVALIKRAKQQYGQIMINTDSGRLVRPLLVVQKGKILLTDRMVQDLKHDKLSFDDLVGKGVIQFLDVNQEDNSLIALRPSLVTLQHTHLQIDPSTILGVVAGIIPFPHHNQSPRNLFQCSMGKQAQGVTGLNELQRVDTIQYMLTYPQKPLVKTSHIELINYDKLPAGHNASVAVMSYSGYDIEDAVMLNKGALDRGFGRSFYFRRYQTQFEKSKEQNCLKDVVVSKATEINQVEKKNIYFAKKKYKSIDEDGLPKVGHFVNNGEIYLNKKTPLVTTQIKDKLKSLNFTVDDIQFIDRPAVLKSHVPLNVDRVIVTSSDDHDLLVKTVFREMRRPELGDKFSSRHGQKGVCGLIVNQQDMPFSQTGWRPDLIMNPHGYPSRMTVGKLLQLIAGKAGALQGSLKYGTSFGGQNAKQIGQILVKNGFSYSGKDALISGINGKYLNCYVFSGPIFYQRLKHMVADKIHARSIGKVTILTRQPTEGRSKEGGLRLGEMQRDCLLGYGGSDILLERLLYSSDETTVLICEGCGFFKYSNSCKNCKGKAVYQVRMPYACKLLFQELISMGIRPKINLAKMEGSPFKQK